MIIGYSVLYINDDITLKDVLWEKRIVYSTWENVINRAMSRAEEEKNRYDNTYIISLISSKSKTTCESYGDTEVCIIEMRDYGKVGSVHIVPVYGDNTS